IPAAVREDLSVKQVEAYFFFRKFDAALPQIENLQRGYLSSPHRQALTEYKLASLYERAMKKCQEASLMKEGEGFDKRWAEAQTNLQAFAALVQTYQGTNYQVLADRTLKGEILTTRVMRSTNAALVIQEVKQQLPNDAEREQFSFMILRLFRKVQP